MPKLLMECKNCGKIFSSGIFMAPAPPQPFSAINLNARFAGRWKIFPTELLGLQLKDLLKF